MKILLYILILVSCLRADSFDRAIAFVLAHEGGYCHDGGHESNYGISSLWYPKENMQAMTKERAIEIYRKDYWLKTECDKVLDSNYALLIFDTAVLFGQPVANRLKRDCSDIDVFMEKRIALTVAIINKDNKKTRYLEGWIIRMLDLQSAIK
jgi:lysozyme family protein